MTDNSARFQYLIWLTPGLLFAGFVLFFSLTQYHIGGRGVETDFYWDYAPAADEFVKGHLPIEHLQFRGPGYPLILASFGWLRDTFLAGKIVSALSAGIVVSLFGYLLIIRFGALLGLVGMGALIINGVFLEYSIRVGTDMFFLMLNLIVVTILGLSKSSRMAGVAGFLAGWAFLTRYNGIALIATVGLWIIITLILKKKDFIRRSLFGLVGVALPVASWLIIYLLSSVDSVHSSNLSNVFYETEALGKTSWDNYWYGNHDLIDQEPRLLTYSNSKRILEHAVGNLYHNLYDDMERLTGELLSALALAGLIVILFKQQYAGMWKWGLIAGIFNYFILLFVFNSPRFSLCLMPVYIALALFFFEWLRQRFNRSSILFGKGIVVASVVFLIVVPPPYTWSKALNKIDQSSDYLIEIANSSEFQSLPKGKIAARKPHLPYLLEMPFVALPILNSTGELLDWMKENRISYLFLDAYGASVRPALSSLLGSHKNLKGIKLIYFREDNPKAGFWEQDSSH